MTTINQLSSVDQVSAGDQVLIYSVTNGDTRRASISTLTKFMQTNTNQGGFATQYAAPNASGFNVQIAPVTSGESMWLVLTPPGTLASGTITLPAVADADDQQEVLVNSTQAVTSMTVAGNGATVQGAPTTLAANASFRLKFEGVSRTWYRIG